MSSMNCVALVGRACNDPERKTVGSDNKVLAKIRIACDRPTNDNKTDFFEIQAWGNQAEVLSKYVKKGHVFGVVGALAYEEWTDNGNKRSKVYIAASSVRLMQPKDKNEEQQQDSVWSAYN